MERLKVLKIPIDIYYLSNDQKNTTPHFFIKVSLDTKRYRISTSFQHLNKNYGIRIKIIRDLKKIQDIFKLDFKDVEHLEDDIIFQKYIDEDNKTEIFLITREFNNEKSKIAVFFSLNFWEIEDYFNEIFKEI
jgi:hypothetical protein